MGKVKITTQIRRNLACVNLLSDPYVLYRAATSRLRFAILGRQAGLTGI